MRKWFELFESAKYRIINQSVLNNGIRVSTVWLGIDHRFIMNTNGQPLIFETMAFKPGTSEDIDCDRWSSLKSARRGHKKMCAKWES